MGTIRFGLMSFSFVVLFTFGCDSRDKQTTSGQKAAAGGSSEVHNPYLTTLKSEDDFNDTITIDGFRVGRSLPASDLIAMIYAQTKHSFVLEPTRLDYVRVTLSDERLPLRDLLRQFEVQTKSKIIIATPETFIVVPNDW